MTCRRIRVHGLRHSHSSTHYRRYAVTGQIPQNFLADLLDGLGAQLLSCSRQAQVRRETPVDYDAVFLKANVDERQQPAQPFAAVPEYAA